MFLNFGYVSLANFLVLFFAFLWSFSRPLSLHFLLCFFWCHVFFVSQSLSCFSWCCCKCFFSCVFFGACPSFIPFCWFRCFVFSYFARRGGISMNYSVFLRAFSACFFQMFPCFCGRWKRHGEKGSGTWPTRWEGSWPTRGQHVSSFLVWKPFRVKSRLVSGNNFWCKSLLV